MALKTLAIDDDEHEFAVALIQAADRLIKRTADKSEVPARAAVAQALKQGGTIEVRIQVEPTPVIRVMLEGPEGEVLLASLAL